MTIYLAIVIGLPVALTLATIASAPFWGAIADWWERARQRRQQARDDAELARTVTAEEVAMFALAKVQQQRADDAEWRAINDVFLAHRFDITAAQIDALETTEERA